MIEIVSQTYSQRDKAQNRLHSMISTDEKTTNQQHTTILSSKDAKENVKPQSEAANSGYRSELVDFFDTTFANYIRDMGTDNVDALAEKFIKEEDKNFHLFKTVGEMSNEQEAMETQIYDMQGELDKLNVGSSGHDRNQKHKLIQELNLRIKKTDDNLNSLEEKFQQSEKEIAQICT